MSDLSRRPSRRSVAHGAARRQDRRPRGVRRTAARARRPATVRSAEPDAVVADRLARQHLGQAGHPARLPLRRHRRHVGRSRPCRSTTRTRSRCSSPAPTPACASCPADRRFAAARYVARGVICVPPMYVNIGAYVGEGTLIDSHALVGSCAQIGARVHVSAAAQIGGVLEPVGALPVIVEDDVLVGGNTGIYEGAVIKQRAVIAAGTVLTGSTPVYDLVNGAHHQAGGRAAAGDSRRRRRRARRARGDGRRRQGLGPVAGDAGDRQVSRRQDGRADGARTVDPVDAASRLARAAHRHRIDDRATKARSALASYLRDRGCAISGYARRPSSRVADGPLSTSFAAVGEPERGVLDALRLRAAVLSEPRRRRRALRPRRRAMRRAFSPRRSPPRSGCARPARRASAWCSSPAKSAAATARKAANAHRARSRAS